MEGHAIQLDTQPSEGKDLETRKIDLASKCSNLLHREREAVMRMELTAFEVQEKFFQGWKRWKL